MSEQESRDVRKREAEEEDDEDDVQTLKRNKLAQPSSDEDDDDEEEEEEEEEEDRRKSKKKKPKNVYFMDEASEEDDEEEEEEEASESEFVEPLSSSQLESRARRFEEQRRFQISNPQDLAREYEERERARNKARGAAASIGGVATISTARLIRERPRPGDPKLFMIRCKPGEEKQLVLKLYRKYITDKFKEPEPVQPTALSPWIRPDAPGAELEVFSVLAPGTSGYIYVEAMQEDKVKAAVRGVPGIFASSITIVPIEEMTDVLRVELRKDIIKKNDYVRLKGPFPYKGDLAKVYSVQDGGNKVTVWVVPRLNMLGVETQEAMKPSNKKPPPPAKLFNPDEIKAAGGAIDKEAHPSLGEIVDWFESGYFDRGLLMLDVNQRQIQNVNVKPKAEELEMFSSLLSSAEGEKNDEIQKVLQKEMSKDKKHVFDFAIGDNVMVTAGAEGGFRGTLTYIDYLRSTAKVNSTEANITIDVRLVDLVKRFDVGDHVRVTSGPHAGKSGSVVAIPTNRHQKPYVTIYTDTTSEELQIYNVDLQMFTGVSMGLESFDNYRLYDLVMLDQNQYGVIIRIHTNNFRVIMQSGKVRDIPPASIRAKKNAESKHATVQDVNQHTLRANDHIIVVSGQYKGAEGSIKHIHEQTIFMYCKQRESENTGILVVKAGEVRIAGSIQQGPNPFGKPRGAVPAGRNATGGGRPLKDNNLGKRVSICRGTNKGLVGKIVGGGAPDYPRVELNARNKVINVPIKDLVFLDQDPSQNRMDSGDRSSMGPPPSTYQAHPVSYATPMYQEFAPRQQTVRLPSSGGSQAFREGDVVKLIDTGESVTVSHVMERGDVVVIGGDGKMKLVSSSNLVFA